MQQGGTGPAGLSPFSDLKQIQKGDLPAGLSPDYELFTTNLGSPTPNRLLIDAAIPFASSPTPANRVAGSPWSMNRSGNPSISRGLTMPSAASASATAAPAPPMMLPSSTVTR